MLPPQVSASCRRNRAAPLFVGSLSVAAVLASIACLVPAAPAAADMLIARANIEPGALNVGGGVASIDPADPQRLLLPLDVTDARGNGAGWSVFLTARPAAGPSPARAQLPRPVVACAADSTCTLPTSSIAYPLTVPLTGAAVKVLNATPGTGMGGIVTTLVLDGTPAGQTVNTTVTVASGP